jgi:hypothetical protein
VFPSNRCRKDRELFAAADFRRQINRHSWHLAKNAACSSGADKILVDSELLGNELMAKAGDRDVVHGRCGCIPQYQLTYSIMRNSVPRRPAVSSTTPATG